MVTMTSNSGVGVSKTFLRENGERFNCSGGRSEMEDNKKLYFSTENPTIYHKSLGDVPEILLLP